MPDIDVGAVALTSPPVSATKTTYRPSFTVRNFGKSPALATGFVRIYKAGRLVFSSDVFTPSIPAGDTKQAQAYNYWKPTETGTYTVSGYITCARDMVEKNNQLPPCSIIVTDETPPTPPIVTQHASQHEEGGDDEITIDGLQGIAAEKQHPLDHASQHSSGGDDEMDVTGLHGKLADGQTVEKHGNAQHEPAMATVQNLSDHAAGTNVHALAANLEHVSKKNQPNGYPGLDAEGQLDPDLVPIPEGIELQENKGAANGYAPLGADSKVPAVNLGGNVGITPGFLYSDLTWRPAPAVGISNGSADLIQITGTTPKVVAQLHVPANTISPGARLDFDANVYTTNPLVQSLQCIIEMKYDLGQEWLVLLDSSVQIPGGFTSSKLHIPIWYWHPTGGPHQLVTSADVLGCSSGTGTFTQFTMIGHEQIDPAQAFTIRIRVKPGDACDVYHPAIAATCVAGDYL